MLLLSVKSRRILEWVNYLVGDISVKVPMVTRSIEASRLIFVAILLPRVMILVAFASSRMATGGGFTGCPLRLHAAVGEIVCCFGCVFAFFLREVVGFPVLEVLRAGLG